MDLRSPLRCFDSFRNGITTLNLVLGAISSNSVSLILSNPTISAPINIRYIHSMINEIKITFESVFVG